MADRKTTDLPQILDGDIDDDIIFYVVDTDSKHMTAGKFRTEYLNGYYALIPPATPDNALITMVSGVFTDSGFLAENGEMKWNTGQFTFKHNITNNETVVQIKGNGATYEGELRVFDADDTEYLKLTAEGTAGILDVEGAAPTHLEARVAGVIGNIRVAEPVNDADAVPKSYLRAAETNEVTGFPNRTDTTLSYDKSTRTFTITPTGADFNVYSRYNKLTLTGAQNVVHTDVEGLHFFYIDTDSTLKTTTTFTDDIILGPKVFVAYLYWDVTNQKSLFDTVFEERHGMQMDGKTHEYLHETFGTQYRNGLGLTDIIVDGGGTLATEAQFGVASGKISDEDIDQDISAILSTNGLEIMYLDGANGDLRTTTNSGYSVFTTGTGLLAWNEWTGTTWQISEVGNNDYVLCHVFATTSNDDPKRVFAVVGQDTYATVITARIGAEVELTNLTTGQLPLKEYKPLGTVIFQTANSYTNAVKARIRSTDAGDDYVDWRLTTIQAIGGTSESGSELKTANLYYIVDRQPNNTGGQGYTAGVWNKCNLNTVLVDNIAGTSISSSVITLPVGTYWVEAYSLASYTNNAKARLRNTSDSTTDIVGDTGHGTIGHGFPQSYHMFTVGELVVSGSSKNFELQVYSIAGGNSGLAANSGELEQYQSIKIWKVS